MPVSVLVRGEQARSPEVDERVRLAFADLHEADARFSPYRADSEVSRLERGEAFPWSPELRAVQALCAQATDQTQGAFDARRPDGRWDPSGLVKTWAVERAAARLRGLDFCLNAGGDVHVEAPSGEPFRVGVQDPRRPERLLTAVPLRRGGVATSGTAARGAHLYDPRSGAPATAFASVTVVGPSLLTADVLATAAFVRGPDVLLPGYEALVVHGDGSLAASEGWNDTDGILHPFGGYRTLDLGSRERV